MVMENTGTNSSLLVIHIHSVGTKIPEIFRAGFSQESEPFGTMRGVKCVPVTIESMPDMWA